MSSTQRVSPQDALVEVFAASIDDPGLFIEEVLRPIDLGPHWKWQRRVCDRLRDRLAQGKRHHKVLIRSCHGAGKTWLAAALSLWWTVSRPQARTLTLAPTWSGVENHLWPNIAALYGSSLIRGWGKMLATALELDSPPHGGKSKWYAIGASSDRPEHLEGHHSPTAAMRVVDEAKAVEPEIYEATTGMLDAPETLDLWISTPSIAVGDFYDRDTDEDGEVVRYVIDVDELIADGVEGKAEWKADCLKDWGLTSPEFQSRVMAKYIDNAEGALFPMSWIERAMEQEFEVTEPLIVGMDCAGSVDGDENAVAVAAGPDEEDRTQVISIDAWHDRDTMVSEGKAVLIARPLECPLRVDVIGLGKGIADAAAADGMDVEEYRASGAASDPSRFENQKAEDAWYFRDRLEQSKIRLLSKDHPLAQKVKAQMKGYRYEIKRSGKIRIIDPADSPDLGDAILIACSTSRTGIQDFYNRKAGAKVKAAEKHVEAKKQSGDPTPWH